MGIFTDMCVCQNQPIVAANKNLSQKEEVDNNIIINQDNKENLEEKKDNKKINNNEVSNDAETFNVSSKGGMIAPKRKKKGKDKLNNKVIEKEKKEKQKEKEKKQEKKADEQQNMINNVFIEDTFDDSNINDTVVSDIVLSEKLKLIPKEKRIKLKDSNKINIVIIGQKEVGKSSFCIRFVENKFEDFYIPSIGIEKFVKMTAYNSRNYKINFAVICGSDKLNKWINLIEEADFFFFFTTLLKLKVLIT